MIKLERFDKYNYADLISWIENKEMLMQLAGPHLTYPLTEEQLNKSQEDKNRIAFNVVDTDTNKVIGHCEIYLLEDSAKLGRILVGDKEQRGKGIGQQIIKELLDYTSQNLPRKKIELYVFDWNIEAIKCYEKAGFKINPCKTLQREINGESWNAVNMEFML